MDGWLDGWRERTSGREKRRVNSLKQDEAYLVFWGEVLHIFLDTLQTRYDIIT